VSLTVDQLESALAMLRKQGVKSYTDVAGGGFTVEFFPAEPPAMRESAKSAAEDDTCACGHHLGRDHMNGFCIHGCLNCNPEEQQEAKPK
jgi:hypothetical protein